MAGNLLMSISQDERERAVFRSRRMYQTDYQSDMATSWDNGEHEGRIRVARNALQKKMSIDDIVDITGLTREEVENLHKEI